MQIRRAVPSDEDILRVLWDDSNRELSFTPYPPAEFAPELIGDHIALIAADGEEVVGCVYAATPSDEHGFVFGLFVIPARRRQGVARALMAAVGEELNRLGRQFAVLSVDTPNASARALYERLGFVDQARTLRADVQRLFEHRS